jgi:metal-sulfur cluster biosynthetic enzyme
MSPTAERDRIVAAARTALDAVPDPCSVAAGAPLGLDEMGLVKELSIDEAGRAEVALRLTSPSCLMHGYFIDEIQGHLLEVEGVNEVAISFDHGEEWEPNHIREDIRRRREEELRSRVPKAVAASRRAAGGE